MNVGSLTPGQLISIWRIVMATKVAGELYYELDGQLSEIKRQLRQPNGYPFDPKKLKEFLQLAVEGRFNETRTPTAEERTRDEKSREFVEFWVYGM